MPTIEIKAKGSDVSYVYQTITQEEFDKICNSLLYNAESQQFLIRFREYIRNTQEFEDLLKNENDAAVRKIKDLSKTYKSKFSTLLETYCDWYPKREYLIEILKMCPDMLDNTFTACSWVRIVASTADLVANIMRITQERDLTVFGFSVGSLSMVGLVSLFFEKMRSKALLTYVKQTYEEDHKLFNNIRNWFKQTEELDNAVKSFFPYGIDEDIARKVNEFTTDADNFSKIFMSVIASNVKRDLKLCKDNDFLDKAEYFATSEAGLHWFNKILLERDPIFVECCNVAQEARIQQAMRTASDVNQTDMCLNFPVQMCKQKAVLDAMNIFVTLINLGLDASKEKSDPIRELAKKTEEEYQNIQKLVNLMKPHEIRYINSDDVDEET